MAAQDPAPGTEVEPGSTVTLFAGADSGPTGPTSATGRPSKRFKPCGAEEEPSMALIPCRHCEGLGAACVGIEAACGHLSSPEMDDAPPCEICNRCQGCCACLANDFRAGLRGE